MTLQGRVKNGVILPIGVATLAEGTLVEIRPIEEATAESERPSAERKTPARVEVFSEPGVEPPSRERQEALRSLIGIWKVDNPPSDEEVERIIDEERMKKYG